MLGFVMDVLLSVIEYPKNLASYRSIPSYGKPHIIAPSFCRGPRAYLASELQIALTVCIILRIYPNGWKMVVSSRMGRRPIGSSSIVCDIIGRKGSAL